MYLFDDSLVVVALFWLPRAVLCCCLGLHEARNSCKAWFPSPVNTNRQQCNPDVVSRHECSPRFLSALISLETEPKPNSRTKSRQKFEEFSSLLFTVTSTALPWDFYFVKKNSCNLLHISFVRVPVHCKGERRKTWQKNIPPFPMV